MLNKNISNTSTFVYKINIVKYTPNPIFAIVKSIILKVKFDVLYQCPVDIIDTNNDITLKP